MERTTQERRQEMRCGYEPPHPLVHCFEAWGHHARKSDDKPTVCVGYSTKLPEVVEVNRARFHKEKSSLVAFCKGEPSELLMRGIEILEESHGEMQEWSMKNPHKDGG